MYHAFTDKVLEAMQESHDLVAFHPNCKRGATHQPWAHGKMVPVGARSPQGGKTGDGYTSYKYMTIKDDNTATVAALMAHARVSLFALTEQCFTHPALHERMRNYCMKLSGPITPASIQSTIE